MSLRDISLPTRITLWALLFVGAGGLLWINQDMQRDRESYLRERSSDLQLDLHLEQARLGQSITVLRNDVLFLASLPPISGIVRASANNGIDLRDRTSMATWQERLQEIFAAFLKAHPEYYQVSYIAAAGEGRELVRVDNNGGRIEVAPREALQAKGDQAFFKAGLVLTAGRVHLSEFTLNQEHGKVGEPPRRTLYAVTTVFDANGNVFGMVVINKDVRSLLALASNGLQPDIRSYIADQYGRYLLHPEAGPASVPAAGGGENVADDFPVLKPVLVSQIKQDESVQTMSDGRGGYLAFERMFFDPSDPSRYLFLLNDLPASSEAHRFDEISPPNLAYTLVVMLLVSGLFMLVLRHTFSPLKRITAAAKEIANGNRDVRLTEAGKGEIGKLTEALNTMLDKLSGSDLIEKENAFRKELIESLPGVFYMIDAQGRYVMWNRNLELVARLSPEEVASSSPLDFFEGEDRDIIEKAMRQVFESGESSVEAVMTAKDGTRTPFHYTGRRVMRDGAPVLIGMGLDITEQRENMREARELLRRNEALMQNSMEGIHVMDTDGNLLEANEAFLNMLGYTREEALQLHVTDWNRQFSTEVLKERMRSRIGRSDLFETVHQRKDGSSLDVEICATGFEIDGKAYVVASSRDISERKKLQGVLQRYKLVLETAMDGFWLTDAEGYLEEVNESYAKMSGYTKEELVGMHISQLDATEREEETRAHIEKLLVTGYDRFETKHRRKDGRIVDIEVAATYLQEMDKIFVFSHNITQRKQAEQALRIAAAAFETHEAILITDAEVNIIRVNKAYTDITGYTPEEAMGKNPRFMSSGRHDREFYAAMWRQILETGTWAGEIWDRRKSGEIYPKWMNITVVKNEQGETTQYVSIFSDITERKRAEDEIRNLAFYDPLTLLPNRRLFLERFHTALAASARYDDFGSILFLDLDRFKLLNDKFGHDYGDLLLVEVASRIKSCVREIDTEARFGGDEFVVLLESISSNREEAAYKSGVVAEKIREALSRPYQLKDLEYRCSPSIGISLYHGNDDSMDVLLKYADAAMYQAKDAGRNNVRFYDPEMQAHWESALAELSQHGEE